MSADRNVPPGEDFLIRCSKLGHQLSFSYCRRENFGLPCAKVLTCWHTYFDVEDHLRTRLTAAEWQQVFEKPPASKAQTLIDLLDQALKRKKG